MFIDKVLDQGNNDNKQVVFACVWVGGKLNSGGLQGKAGLSPSKKRTSKLETPTQSRGNGEPRNNVA